ncbi:CheY-like superfamily [Penicillium angulare]|uniref:CheY-like superfamily n=1 Tax=Penicillium angulare TaxID=116970 RepID=UPI0025405FCA|nr:CheY-like superfamily [Penicillium angulare]KAJ5263885.1 CheY-like superfamily [Penicillium angulare]
MSLSFDANVSAQQLVEILPNGVAVLNHQYELISASRRFQQLIPCFKSNFRDCWLDSVCEDDYKRAVAEFQQASNNGSTLRTEYRISDEKGLWCSLILERLESADLRCFGLDEKGGFVCTVADITSTKVAEIVQRKAAEAAQESKKQQERFIDMISHEVRNPLSAILHCTEDILEAVNQKATEIPKYDIAEAAETIGLCVSHQKKIVNDVLTFSKLDASMLALSPRSVQPQKQLAKPLAIFRPELRKQHIEFEYKADLSYHESKIDWAMADLDRMGQVLVNLLSNAVKFTSQSKNERMIRVSIGAAIDRPTSYPPNVVFFDSGKAALKEDATNTPEWGSGEIVYIMVAVKDSGIGISDLAQKKLFQRFNQATPKTESVYGGSGLGLNVCRKLCHVHGGEIGVSSKEGHGSTFGFFFKVRRADPGSGDESGRDNTSQIDQLVSGIQGLGNEVSGVNQTTEQPVISENPHVTWVGESEPGATPDHRTVHSGNIARQVSEEEVDRHQKTSNNIGREQRDTGYRILLVEDNIINRRILSKKLKSAGFHITEATNGQEAVDAARENTFDCILMDQEMPVMNGCTASMAIRDTEQDSCSHVPILGVTANARAEQDAELLSSKMDDVIHKPYGIGELIQKINYMVDHSG